MQNSREGETLDSSLFGFVKNLEPKLEKWPIFPP